MDYKTVFEKFEKQNGFIKTSSPSIDGQSKAALNRKGNVLFNSGDIEAARRIFLTTGYSDGLSRIGDWYKSQGKLIDALRMYRLAPDRSKSEPIIMQLAGIVQNLMREEGDEADE